MLEVSLFDDPVPCPMVAGFRLGASTGACFKISGPSVIEHLEAASTCQGEMSEILEIWKSQGARSELDGGGFCGGYFPGGILRCMYVNEFPVACF